MKQTVYRDGKPFVYRNLDSDGLTAKEAALQEKITRRDAKIGERIVLASQPDVPRDYLGEVLVTSARGTTRTERELDNEIARGLIVTRRAERRKRKAASRNWTT